ncbi:MAG: hypothetical protein A2W90_21350 [Bacteroidetes bacterium GWF2_42_66]|nr:MAG: hypothetical protein A2W92_02465 [Bacteroidetes bacterium GWA2_42_15]OFX98880.1 MAG: hypothetical protein A2W89_12985 [Bacteroidetes bacterium GWE2_42_39]OFY45595.1 MAG: hypothetical protein A2W90_21350 [Bacteroidetes bacterium GWF2_42_66]HBL77425.1 hypothetical protein [Prolixibacteraceae bacterium]HCU62411.1 hypothetical protein [Prolixibacteraceae bacterium]
MKNKKFTYFVLIPAVIVVWGLIVYKIIARDSNTAPGNFMPETVAKEEKIVRNEEYKLLNNYPDPFSIEKIAVPVKKTEKTRVSPPSVPKYNWPDIRFNGYILNGDIARAHITINGENKILMLNDNFSDGYILTGITKDSIKVRYQSGMKWFSKK